MREEQLNLITEMEKRFKKGDRMRVSKRASPREEFFFSRVIVGFVFKLWF